MNCSAVLFMAGALACGSGASAVSYRDLKRFCESDASAGRIERAIVRRERVSQAKLRKRRRRTGR